MPFRLPSSIGSNRARLYLAGPTFFISLLLTASYAGASFEPENKVLAKISYWFPI
jgi:hypothetical protein